MSVLTDIAKFRQLSSSDRSLLLHAMVLLVVTGIGLRWVSFRRFNGGLSKARAVAGATHSPLDFSFQAKNTARIVSIAARHSPYRANCLPTSLVLRHLLLRQGIQVDLRVGVRKADDGNLDAHAWVEHEGQPLIDGPDVRQRYAPFPGTFDPRKALQE